MNKKILIFLSVLILIILFILTNAWYFSSQVLYPPWKTRDLSDCKQNFTDENWGPDCGNLRMNKKYFFNEINANSENGTLYGWHIPYNFNRNKQVNDKNQAIFFFHGAGYDRRQGFKYVDFFLNNGYDVYLFDISGHGESTNNDKGISLGEREFKDAIAVYEYLRIRHKKIIAMGTSMGGVSILNAIDHLPGIKGIILENPFYSTERLIKEAPQASFIPQWIKSIALKLIYFRGKFNAQHNPDKSILVQSKVPILFIHSKTDMIIPYQQSIDLYQRYRGPKKILLTESGLHCAVWNSHREIVEKTMDNFLNNFIKY